MIKVVAFSSVFLVLFVLALVLISKFEPWQGMEPSAPVAIQPVFRVESERDRLRSLLEEAERRDRAALEEMEADIQRRLAPISHGESDIDSAVGELTSLTSCMKIIALSALDTIQSTDQAGDMIGVALAPIYSDRVQRSMLVERAVLEEFTRKLAANTSTFCSSAGSIAGVETNVVAPPAVDFKPGASMGPVNSFVWSTSTGVIFFGVDALAIQGVITRVGNVLARQIARMSGALTVSGLAILIDGLIPVGDIVGAVITIGGTLWTAHDLNQTRTTLGRELGKGIRNDLGAYQEKVRKSTIEEAYRWYEENRSIRNDYAEQLISSRES